MISNNGKREEKERDRALESNNVLLQYCNKWKIESCHIYKSYISAYILYKPKIQHHVIVFVKGRNKQNYYCQYEHINFWVKKIFNAFGASFIKSWLYLFVKDSILE